MAWELTVDDIEDLARGAAVLGTGGGGDPHMGQAVVTPLLAASGGRVRILDPEELPDDGLVIPTAAIGAPTVLVEKPPNGAEPMRALRALERYVGREAEATMPVECGGWNSMIPLLVAAESGLPVVDADGMGRAFPELQMETFCVYGVPASPLVVADEHGSTVVIDTGADNERMERMARAVAIRMGASAYTAGYAMTGAQVRRTAIPRTLSLALRIGRTIRLVRRDHKEVLTALAETLAAMPHPQHIKVVFDGKVVDVERRTTDGFASGRARIAGSANGDSCEIVFQNENLVARVDGDLRAIVPDLIVVLDAESVEPITTEALRYGQRVRVFAISTPPIMRTPEALATFGPRAFGLDTEFTPMEMLA